MSFSPSDADAWYRRNKHKLGVGVDPVMTAIEKTNCFIGSVLEIGCANGWRLKRLQDRFSCAAYGIDLSRAAIRDYKPSSWLSWTKSDREVLKLSWAGEATLANFANASFGNVIYGFWLYLADPQYLWEIAREGDRVLKDGGRIIIHDFLPEYPYARVFEHNDKLLSRKMNHAELWLAHPWYSMEHRDIYGEGDERTAVTILTKNTSTAFPIKEETNVRDILQGQAG